MKNTEKPECAEWNLWRGAEIEGHTDLGVPTLFVRKASTAKVIRALEADLTLRRVWLCEDYLSGRALREVCSILLRHKRKVKVCVAVRIGDVSITDHLRLGEMEVFIKNSPHANCGRFNVYLKLDLRYPLRNGDHICVGNAFTDEAFRIGDGRKVTPEMYKDDTFIA